MYFFYFILFFLFFCCNSAERLVHYNNQETTDLQFFYKEPYCGGARPPSELQPSLSPISGQKFYYGEWKNGKGGCNSFVLDENGAVSLILKSDTKYAFYSEGKMQDFNVFLKRNKKEDQRFINKSIDCYRDWWDSADVKYISRKEKKAVQLDSIIIPLQCYIRNHKCISYVGPRYR